MMDLLTIFNQPNSLAVDITGRCNLSCGHCYFHRYDHNDEEELTVDSWRERIRELKARHHLVFAMHLGGEPLLRPDVVTAISDIIRYNVVYTNGSLSIPRLPRCVVAVTIDSIRNRETINGLPIERTEEVIATTSARTVGAMTVMGSNRHEIAEVVNHCSGLDVRGMLFNFYVPMKGEDCPQRMTLKERDEAIRDIRALRREYPGFILNSDAMLRLTTSKYAPEIMSRCPIRSNVICLDAGGRRKEPCTFGPKAECDQCGAQAAFMHQAAFTEFDPETFYGFMWGVTHGRPLFGGYRR
ncbi:MAG: radical SAM protein [Methanopyri archaeon]|nr:radical SAM protein [Methanopyri archaeon]